MSTGKVLHSIGKTVDAYERILASVGDDVFTATPSNGGWSYSEVYSHIFDSSLLSLQAVQKCIDGGGANEKTTFGAKAILFFGMLPPGKRYKVPKRLAERVKKIDFATAEQFIDDFGLQLAKITPQLGKSNPSIKVAHPRLGFLNARQWLRFIEIHLNHHLKQLKRIENSFV
ncbi:DinB family protein [Pedobacter sp. Du54]|uniref:DinB family protein n=1 Tax=Pedobacter anseongensis TaxID=3133439 RepID=UPI0030A4C338